MLSIYTSSDRDLLFHGNYDAARERGIELHADRNEIVLDGKRRRVVNTHTEPGYLGLWVS